MLEQTLKVAPLRSALLALIACLLLAPLRADADEFRIVDGHVFLHQDVYYLTARVVYQLSPAVREAMHSGLPLTVELQIQLERPRRWLWDERVARLSQRYRLRYHDLSGRYILSNLNSGESTSFSYESAAMAALGMVDMLPLIDRRLLEPDELYRVRMRARLDVSDLPQPLRSLAMVSRQWRLASDWFSWLLRV